MPKPTTTTPASSPENYLTAGMRRALARSEAKYGPNSVSANMFRAALKRGQSTHDVPLEEQVIIQAPFPRK